MATLVYLQVHIFSFAGDVLPKGNNLVYVDSETYNRGCETFCQADNAEQ